MFFLDLVLCVGKLILQNKSYFLRFAILQIILELFCRSLMEVHLHTKVEVEEVESLLLVVLSEAIPVITLPSMTIVSVPSAVEVEVESVMVVVGDTIGLFLKDNCLILHLHQLWSHHQLQSQG